MGQIANRRDLHHARAALERVQITQQVFHFQRVVRIGLPAHQRRAAAFDDVVGFFEEDFQQFRITLVQRVNH